jgi:hypothetical protein
VPVELHAVFVLQLGLQLLDATVRLFPTEVMRFPYSCRSKETAMSAKQKRQLIGGRISEMAKHGGELARQVSSAGVSQSVAVILEGVIDCAAPCKTP